ncbi:histidine kinase [Paenibacillus wynnii]|uniref:histidine kinase n=1 Tax=Paenibacillus wynnii TaxID=268407 RepID=A0A098MDQ2_9BACL|nr:histidine kinase [Paenibacillus wynnii]
MERASVLTDEVDIEAYRQNCFHAGIDPEQPPFFAERFSAEGLEEQLIKYKEIIEVIESFVNKFLSSVTGSPILVAISDAEGYLLAFKGDPTIIDTVRLVGMQEGVRFTEEVGLNSISLCLRYQKSFQLVGQDHFHHILHGLVCCTAPFYKEDGQELLGTISFMADIEAAHPHLLPLLCTMADSIERELLLRKGNAQFQLLNRILLETNYLGVIITDELGTIVNINDNAAEMLQMETAQYAGIIGTHVFSLNDVGDYFRRVILQQEDCAGVELTLEREGSAQHFIIDVVPVYDATGSLSRVIGSLRNITEMKKTEEVLRNTEKLVFAGELAMSIAHEIRNPLTTIKGMLQLSNKNSQLPHYNLIMSEVERVNLIVGEFLILGKPQAVQFKKERCSTILQEVLHIFEFQAKMNRITIHTQVNVDSVIDCDRNQIKQVCLNLLRNSLEALPFGGMIRIELNTGDGFQTIKFSDNGEGMSHEVLQNIGMAFHTTRTNGNGLGIMIVKKIVSAHRGHVEITSEVGVGTIVTIYLPT